MNSPLLHIPAPAVGKLRRGPSRTLRKGYDEVSRNLAAGRRRVGCCSPCTAALGIGIITAGAQAPATTSGDRARGRHQRLAARRVLVHVGQHGAVGAGRADRLAGRRRVPRERHHLRGDRRREHRQRRLQRPRRARRPAGEHAYSYRVGAEGGWSSTYTFKTQKFDGNFDFLFYGDPQIGSSGNVPKDGAGWDDTLNVSLAANPNAELLVSGGDQVETANTESQWNAFLNSDKLRSYPWAATIGNHDVGGKAYDQHFWTPNTDRSANFYSGSTTSQSGGDYWYMYKGALFIHLNSQRVRQRQGRGARRLRHAGDAGAPGGEVHGARLPPRDLLAGRRTRSTAMPRSAVRTSRPPSRTSASTSSWPATTTATRAPTRIKNGQKANASEQPGAAQVATGPGGVIYVTGNSASGSKYYDLTKPGGTQPAGPAGPDRQPPLRELGREPGARPHLRQGPGALRRARRREHPLRHVRGPERRGRARQRESWCGPNSGASAGPAGRLRGRQGRRPRGRGARRRRRRRHRAGHARPDAGHARRRSAPFTPGVAKDYTASSTATVISTAGDATLTASDPSSTAPGRLVNGSFSLASAAAGRGHAAAVDGQDLHRSGLQRQRSRSTTSSRSPRTSRCARAPTRRRSRSRCPPPTRDACARSASWWRS